MIDRWSVLSGAAQLEHSGLTRTIELASQQATSLQIYPIISTSAATSYNLCWNFRLPALFLKSWFEEWWRRNRMMSSYTSLIVDCINWVHLFVLLRLLYASACSLISSSGFLCTSKYRLAISSKSKYWLRYWTPLAMRDLLWILIPYEMNIILNSTQWKLADPTSEEHEESDDNDSSRSACFLD